jgi:hypothetical protein
MDFFFIPGDTPAETAAKKYFPKRPGSKLPKTVKSHLAGFLETLGEASITKPIGDIIVVAHGTSQQYFLKLKGSVASPADFENVVAADSDDSIRIGAALVTPAGGGAQTTITVRLMGCNIGQGRPLIEKFKSAMTPAGGAIHVIAPLHFDEVDSIKGGLLEFLAQKFTLRVKEKFKSKALLLDAFDKAKFSFLDGTKIPTAAWKDLVPDDIHPSSHQKFPFFADLDPPANSQTNVKIHREYRFDVTRIPFATFGADPGNDHDRIELLRRDLPKAKTAAGLKVFDPNYPWPLWQRIGFASLNDFVDNLAWKDVFDSKAGKHNFTAELIEYTVMLPLTDPPAAVGKTPKMKFYNFYPDAAAGTADMRIDETNPQLYLIL